MSTGSNLLRHILDYYSRTRGVGHTNLTLWGARNIQRPFILLVADKAQQRTLKNLVNGSAKIVTIDDAREGRLQGWTGPLMVDHAALELILAEAQGAITSLEDYIVKSGEQRKRMRKGEF